MNIYKVKPLPQYCIYTVLKLNCIFSTENYMLKYRNISCYHCNHILSPTNLSPNKDKIKTPKSLLRQRRYLLFFCILWGETEFFNTNQWNFVKEENFDNNGVLFLLSALDFLSPWVEISIFFFFYFLRNRILVLTFIKWIWILKNS